MEMVDVDDLKAACNVYEKRLGRSTRTCGTSSAARSSWRRRRRRRRRSRLKPALADRQARGDQHQGGVGPEARRRAHPGAGREYYLEEDLREARKEIEALTEEVRSLSERVAGASAPFRLIFGTSSLTMDVPAGDYWHPDPEVCAAGSCAPSLARLAVGPAHGRASADNGRRTASPATRWLTSTTSSRRKRRQLRPRGEAGRRDGEAACDRRGAHAGAAAGLLQSQARRRHVPRLRFNHPGDWASLDACWKQEEQEEQEQQEQPEEERLGDALAPPLRQGERTPAKGAPQSAILHAQAHEDHGRAEPQTARTNEHASSLSFGRDPPPLHFQPADRHVLRSTRSAKPACLSLIVDICPYPESADARLASRSSGREDEAAALAVEAPSSMSHRSSSGSRTRRACRA